MKKGVKVYKRHFMITSGEIINDFLFKDAILKTHYNYLDKELFTINVN